MTLEATTTRPTSEPPELEHALVATPRNYDRATFGPAAGLIARALGYSLDPWQRYVLDVALEVDDDGRPWYRFVRLGLGRQNGKTLLGLCVLVDRLLVGRRRGWGPRQRALYGAQTGRMARAKLLDTWAPAIEESPTIGPALTNVVRSNGDEALVFGDAMVSVIPTSRKAGHGGTNHLVMLDEVFAHTTDDVIKGTRPTMLTVPAAQEWALSAAGDTPDDSPVWWAMLEDIRARQASRAWGRTCGFEWGAGPEDDRADPATWAHAMPALVAGRITADVVRAELEACRTAADFAAFDRGLLDRWGGGAARLIPEGSWTACCAPMTAAVGELEMAIDVCPGHDGTPRWAHIVAAGRDGQGVPVVELVDSRAGTGWLVDRVAELDQRHDVWSWTIDAVGPVRALRSELEQTVGANRLHVATTQEACAAAERFHVAILEGQVRHRGQTVLDTAAGMAAKRDVGDGQWCWGRRRSSGDVSPIVAAGLAHLRLLTRPTGPLKLGELVMDLETMEHMATDLSRAVVPRGVRPLQAQPESTQAMWFTGWGESPVAPLVSSERVLGLPAAWRAVLMIGGGVAAMAPPRCVGPDTATPVAAPQVVARPNAMYGVTEWWSMVVAQAAITGNFVGVLADFDVDGYARQVVPVPTRMVNARYRDGFPVYEIGDREYSWAEVAHVRWLPIPGQVLGVGPVTAHRLGLGVSMAQQDNALSLWQRHGVPTGILKVHRPKVSADQARDAREEWLTARSEGGPAVYGDEFDFAPLAWSPEDAQFLESRQFSVAEVALMFGLDPSDLGASLGAGGALTYANLSTRLSARVVDTLGPWLGRFEDAWSDLIPGGNLVRFRRESYAHASRRELLEELGVAIDKGLITEDEARAELNLPPMPAAASSARVIAETAQKVYLAVGPVITRAEAREMLRAAGAVLDPANDEAPQGDAPPPAAPPEGPPAVDDNPDPDPTEEA